MAYNGLAMSEDDIKKIIAANICAGAVNIREEMKPYVWRRGKEGVHVFDIKKFWDKLVLAARVLVAIENPGDIACLSEREYGQRAVLKFASFTGAQPIAGKYTPGTFTNQITKQYCEPRILVCQSPLGEHQAITEAAYTNMPVISFCNSDCNLKNVDIAIPCNNNSVEAIGTCWWLLCRQLLKFAGKIPGHSEWDIMPDLFFHRDQDAEDAQEEEQFQQAAPAAGADEWGAEATGQPTATAGAQAFAEFTGADDFGGNWADVDYDQPIETQGQQPATGVTGVTPGGQMGQQMGYAQQPQYGQPQGGQQAAAAQPQALPAAYFPPEENLEAW